MTRPAPTLPGYASVARASEVLHLAARSVRDLIYAGRLPSLRVGRLHYIKSSDLDLERRRRLGVPLPRRSQAPKADRPHRPRDGTRSTPASAAAAPVAAPDAPEVIRMDTERRRQRAAQRAAERAELVERWARRHQAFDPRVPAVVIEVTSPVACEACGRDVRRGRVVELSPEPDQTAGRLCLACGRRALLDWADRRRLEAAAARRISRQLAEPRARVSAIPDAA